jgi:hypothetical protein
MNSMQNRLLFGLAEFAAAGAAFGDVLVRYEKHNTAGIIVECATGSLLVGLGLALLATAFIDAIQKGS